MSENMIGNKKRGLDFIGGVVDSFFLGVPRLLKPFKPKRKIDRAAYEKQLDFYMDNGYVDHPETFFTLSEHLSPYTICQETPYRDGRYQIISFPSGYETKNPLIRDRYDSYKENKTGYLVRWTHGDAGRKTVLCLHGYMLGEPMQAHRMFKIRKLFEMGLDVALYITPFHWKRSPAFKALRGIFLQPDNVTMTCECFGQAMDDLNQTVRILEDLGTDAVGMIGASLGGYNASLYSCLTDRVSFAAMMVPAVNFSKPFGPDTVKMSFQIDHDLKEKINRVWELHSPVNLMPKIPKENIIFIASRGDKLCPFENVLRICEKWNWPQYRFLTGGHWLIFNEKERGRVWYSFLKEMGFV